MTARPAGAWARERRVLTLGMLGLVVDAIMLLVALLSAALAGRVPGGVPRAAALPSTSVHTAAVVLPPVEEV